MKEIRKSRHELPQDVVVNSVVIKKATKNHASSTRYQLIQKVLDQYKRPFTMLDIGANHGYYSFRTAYDYNAVCVLIEADNPRNPHVGKRLLELCKANDELDNIVFLNREMRSEDFLRLGECEHFDVVLALNILHWYGEGWRDLADAIFTLGKTIIIEAPPQEPIPDGMETKHKESALKANVLRKEIEDYLLSKNAKILGKARRHTHWEALSTLYIIENEQNLVWRKTWLHEREKIPFQIHSTFETKTFIQGNCEPKSWLPGINLMTFKMNRGVYPPPSIFQTALKKVEEKDLYENILVQGETVAIKSGNGQRKKRTKTTFKLLTLNDPKKVEQSFKEQKQ